jgi:molybdopterin synthase sulfur carrier subunit
MRELTRGRARVEAPGQTVGQVIEALEARYPGLKARLCQGDRLRPGLIVSVDGRMARPGLLAPVGEASEIHFAPALAGG